MPRVRSSALVAVSLATSLLLGGCGSGTDPEASSGRPDATASPTLSGDAAPPTAEPSAQPSARPSSPSSTRKPGRHKVGTLRPRMRLDSAAHLLDADALPALGEGRWTVGTTGPEDPEHDPTVGACQKTLLGPIGAVETVRRTFTAPGRLGATQVVARFADARSAWRAHQVLVAWRADCADRIGGGAVGPLEPLTVRTGTGETYRTAARKRAAGLGIHRSGSFLTLVEITAGAEHYPTNWDPARVAVRRVARTY